MSQGPGGGFRGPADDQRPRAPLSVWDVLRFWAPLALMWLLMSTEQPILAAFISRLPDAEQNLAAFGLSFSIALIVESPVIMLLTAGTALTTGPRAYRRLLTYTHVMALVLGILHAAIAFSPAFGFLITGVIDAPDRLVAPGQAAFQGMILWTPAIAYRRLWQGVLIRYGHPGRVSVSTVLRISALLLICIAGLIAQAHGALLGGVAMSGGVVVGATVAWALVRSTVRDSLTGPDEGQIEGAARSVGAFARFYVPLALTSLLILGAQPLISFALGRAPDAVRALAVWPVIMGLLFILRSGGYAYQEVAVALLERPDSARVVRRVAIALSVALSAGLAGLVASPAGRWWLEVVTALPEHLVPSALTGLALLIPVPGLSALVSWLRGVLVESDRTGPVTLAVGFNLVVLFAVLLAGLTFFRGELDGAALAAVALDLSMVAEVVFLAGAVRYGERS